MQTDVDVIVIGGGFAGLYAAWRLAQDGTSVALVERSDHLGGALWSQDWQGYLVDTGMHNFDLRGPPGADFYADILGEKMMELVGHDWASTTGGALTTGFEMPDFSTSDPGLCKTALAELAELAFSGTEPAADDLVGWIMGRFGQNLGVRISDIAEKIVGGPVDGLASESAAALGMLTRAKLGTDAEMIALKERGVFWDDRLGVSLTANDPRFSGRSVVRRFGYPASGAMGGFCTAAVDRLRDLGVRMHLSTDVTGIEISAFSITASTSSGSISATRLFWSLSDQPLLDLLGTGTDIDLRQATHPVGAAVHAFEINSQDCSGPDYVHDYTLGRRAYRYSRPGIFGGQITPKGRSYILAEVPCHPAASVEAKSAATADRVWADMQAAGYIAEDAVCFARTTWVYPVAFTLPRLGWRDPMEQAAIAMSAFSGRIVRIPLGNRGRAQFMAHYDEYLHDRLRG
jgi:glycine/D-amino acid oxidase-like deaminating enzyme